MSFWMDFRYALRMLRRTPSVTLILVLTLALCIGANTAIFSVVDATLLRPLPYPEPDRLIRVVTHFRGHEGEGDSISQTGTVWETVRDHAGFLDAAVYSASHSGVNFAAAGNVQYVEQQRVGAGFFRVLGVSPLIGREFTPQEDRPGGPPIAILSYHLWKRAFNADASVVGKPAMLRGEPYTIIGVMPASFDSSVPADLWTPLKPTTTGEGSGINYSIAGRLKPGVTWAQADQQIEAIGAPLIQAMKFSKDVSVRLKLVTLQEGQTQGLRKPVLILWAAVGLVLLIGCANVTSLLLARAATRTREMATRLALGGGRRAIFRQLVVESLVLAVAGGAAGLLMGYAGIEGLKNLAQDQFPTVSAVRLDARVLAVTALLALFTSLLAGIFPAVEASAVDIRSTLSEAGGRGVTGIRKRWSRRLLVSGEIALAVLLLIGAGLLIRTLAHLYRLNPGFDPRNVIVASFSLQDARYSTSQKVNQLFDAGLERIRELPGVESAAVGLTLPYQRNLNDGFRHMGDAEDKYYITDLCYVTPDYFHTLRIPLEQGRAFRASDGPSSAPVLIVNQAFVKKYLGKQQVIGNHLFAEDQGREIVGVVGDVQQQPGWGTDVPLTAPPTLYIPAAQTPDAFLKGIHIWFSPNWVVRAAGPPQKLIHGIELVAAKIDPMVPIAAFHTIQDLRSRSLEFQRFQTLLLTALSALALVLAIVGIYGLMSQSVAERRRELGIRIALGSTLARAIRDAAAPGILLALGGAAAGCLLAVMSTSVLGHLVWGVGTLDALTFMSVPLGLLVVAAAASLIPALRIARLNPAETLREE